MHGQNVYASIVRIIRAKDEKKGIDFPTKMSVLRNAKRKGRQ